MAFGAQQIYPQDLNVSQAIGINLPLNGPAVFKSNFQTKDAIKNNLINFFLTNPGERYLNPEFGGGLRAFIFEQISNNSIQNLNEDITNKLQENFSNINVDKLNILREDDNNTIIVSLTYSVPNTNIKDNIKIQF
jgi:phage baseplate assembly protein W